MIGYTLVVAGCRIAPNQLPEVSDAFNVRPFVFSQGSMPEVIAVLSALHLEITTVNYETKTLYLRGSEADLNRAAAVVDLIDSRTPYLLERIGPASLLETAALDKRITEQLNVAVGTLRSRP